MPMVAGNWSFTGCRRWVTRISAVRSPRSRASHRATKSSDADFLSPQRPLPEAVRLLLGTQVDDIRHLTHDPSGVIAGPRGSLRIPSRVVTGTWHWRHRVRSGWVVTISARAPGPAWQAAQFSRMRILWGMVGGAPRYSRLPASQVLLAGPGRSFRRRGLRPIQARGIGGNGRWRWLRRCRQWGEAGANPTPSPR